MKIGDDIVENMMHFAQYHIILQELQDGGSRMEGLNDGIFLPKQCSSSLGGCQVHDRTYIWKVSFARCSSDKGCERRGSID